ncbi:MAG: hypothetical protein Q9199_004250 [Rusavskia elegans]
MESTPGRAEDLNNLASRRRCHPFQPGLGSLSVLPPEIRSQIWEIALPKTNDCFELEPLETRSWTVLATRQVKRRNTLGFARASKQLYEEVIAQFFHKRSLAVVFTTADYLLLSRQRDSWQPWTSMRGMMVNSIGLARSFSATNFANFASIKLLIELPHPISIGNDIKQLVGYVQSFSLCVQNWQEGLGLHSSCPSINVVLYTRPTSDIKEDTADDDDDDDDDDSSLFENPQNIVSEQSYPALNDKEDTAVDYGDVDDIDWGDVEADYGPRSLDLEYSNATLGFNEPLTDSDGERDYLFGDVEEDDEPHSIDPEQLYPSLKTIALLLQPLRDIQKAKVVTIEADFELHFGQEWLPELLGQVADDMQKAGKTRPGHWRWRQKNMEVALDQSDQLTRDIANLDIAVSGGVLPVGLPEEPPNDGIE